MMYELYVRFCRTKRMLKRLRRYFEYLPTFLAYAYCWDYETCIDCGRAFRVGWDVDNAVWKQVMRVHDDSGGSLCVDCFYHRAIFTLDCDGPCPHQFKLYVFDPEERCVQQ